MLFFPLQCLDWFNRMAHYSTGSHYRTQNSADSRASYSYPPGPPPELPPGRYIEEQPYYANQRPPSRQSLNENARRTATVSSFSNWLSERNSSTEITLSRWEKRGNGLIRSDDWHYTWEYQTKRSNSNICYLSSSALRFKQSAWSLKLIAILTTHSFWS